MASSTLVPALVAIDATMERDLHGVTSWRCHVAASDIHRDKHFSRSAESSEDSTAVGMCSKTMDFD